MKRLLPKLPLTGISPQGNVKNGNYTGEIFLECELPSVFWLLLIILQDVWGKSFCLEFAIVISRKVGLNVPFASIGKELCIFLNSEIPVLCEVLVYLNVKCVPCSRENVSN